MSKTSKPVSDSDKFVELMKWAMQGTEKEPRTQEQMFRQSIGTAGKTMLVVGWLYAKSIGLIFKSIKGGYNMVFGRGKKKVKGDPTFRSPDVEDYLNRVAAQINQPPMQHPVQQQMQQPVPPIQQPMQPPVQQSIVQQYQPPFQQPAQPPMQQPAQPPMQQPSQPQMQQPAQPQMQHPVQPPVQLYQSSPPVPQFHPPIQHSPVDEATMTENLILGFLTIGERLKAAEEHIAVIESFLKNFDSIVDDVYNRLNMIQGVQPSSKKRIKFDNR